MKQQIVQLGGETGYSERLEWIKKHSNEYDNLSFDRAHAIGITGLYLFQEDAVAYRLKFGL